MSNLIRLIVIATCIVSLSAVMPRASLAAEPAQAGAVDAEPAAQVLDALRQLTLALKSGQARQIDQWVHAGQGADGAMVRVFLLQEAALGRLDRAWGKRFGGVFVAPGSGHLIQGVYGGLDCLLETALGELQSDDVVVEGNTAQVVLDVRRGDVTGHAHELFGVWSDAIMRMVLIDGRWKLDLPSTFKVRADAAFVQGKAPASEGERLQRHLHFREQTVTLTDELIRKLEAGEFAGPLAARQFVEQEADRLLAADGLASLRCEVLPAK
jgi:hypothetical protein